MENIAILIIFLTIMCVTLLGMIKRKLLLFNNRIFVQSERITGWRAVAYGFMLEIIFVVVMFIWISSGEIKFTNLQLTISVIVSIILTIPLYMFMHMVEGEKRNL